MKQALCIPTPHIMPNDGVHFLHGTMPLLPVTLIDRAICETDTSTLQLIPYIVVRNQVGMIFTYSRGKAGDEDRLLAQLSIGLGGHVDRAPVQGESLMELLQAEGARELKEEVGLVVEPSALHFTRILVNRADSVGCVHLGLLAVYTLRDGETIDFAAEKDIISDAKFMTLDKLSDSTQYERLENWSRMVVDELAGRL